jgi:putative transposase
MLVEKCTTTEGVREETWSVLEALAREGARALLQQALENEVAEYIEAHSSRKDGNGHRLVVRNGSMPERTLLTGMGPLLIRQPRVDDRGLKQEESAERFSSGILPRYLRRVPSVDNLLPALYLKGVSSKEFLAALSAILGEGAKGLSATNIVRLKAHWEQEYHGWATRDLSGKEYVYLWADGVYFNVRLEGERSCILVLIGCNLKGEKELLALSDGFRESELSWLEMLRDLKARGLKVPPKLAVGDGGLGFWCALGKEFPETKWQRCWVHYADLRIMPTGAGRRKPLAAAVERTSA